MLHTIAEVQEMIAQGKSLLLAGSDSALAKLDAGNWIAGTIPYFMDAGGAVCSEDRVFVTLVPAYATRTEIVEYGVDSLANICVDAPENGFSALILPFGSDVHVTYAQDAPSYEGMYLKPVVGWISGVHVSRIGTAQPKVYNGTTRTAFADRAVVIHVELPAGKLAELDIVNVFTPGGGDAITFPASGFLARECNVNGAPANFAEYMDKVKADRRLPLTASYNGSIVNVSVQEVDSAKGEVRFYSPVFQGLTYEFAAPVADYLAAFNRIAARHEKGTPVFACNCILNYLYAELEGRKTGSITGPITFGEIAHQLLNQTLVQLRVLDVEC